MPPVERDAGPSSRIVSSARNEETGARIAEALTQGVRLDCRLSPIRQFHGDLRAVKVPRCALRADCSEHAASARRSSSVPDGSRWGDAETLPPGWQRAESAPAADAAKSPWVWATLAAAADQQVDSCDEDVVDKYQSLRRPSSVRRNMPMTASAGLRHDASSQRQKMRRACWPPRVATLDGDRLLAKMQGAAHCRNVHLQPRRALPERTEARSSINASAPTVPTIVLLSPSRAVTCIGRPRSSAR